MPVSHPKFRAAAVQAAPVFLDLDASIDKSIRLIAEAAGNGARLIAFPETFLPGYPWFIWLDSPAWGMQFIQRYHDNSLVYGSPQADRLAQAAKDHAITVVMGHSEKQGGSLYMGQWIIGADGRTIVAELGSALVAHSAGVDSTLVLKVAYDMLGTRAVAGGVGHPRPDGQRGLDVVRIDQ